MPWRENKGVANLNGIYTDGFWGCFARNLWRKSLIKYGRRPEIIMSKNLVG